MKSQFTTENAESTGQGKEWVFQIALWRVLWNSLLSSSVLCVLSVVRFFSYGFGTLSSQVTAPVLMSISAIATSTAPLDTFSRISGLVAYNSRRV